MPVRLTPRIKICCIGSPEEARAAVEAGANALGLVSAMPSGPGPIPEADIARIAAGIPPGVSRFLLTCLTGAEEIIRQQQRTGVDTLQLVDRVEPGTHARLRRELPGIRVVQVIHVTGPTSVTEALAVAPEVDALLLDSGNQDMAVKELGGTGRVHDWALSREIRERASVPVFLAGGLTAENVADAIAAVQPFGVDVCSGVRTEGSLDPERLERFVRAVRA